MKRRHFIKSFAQTAAMVPLAGKLLSPSEAHEEQPQTVPQFEIKDWLDIHRMPEVEGWSSGVAAVDEITNGFFPGQLVSVHGPLADINIAFLFNCAIYNALTRKRVDYCYTQSNFFHYYNRMFWTLKPYQRKEMYDELVGQEFLRLPDIDLGDPSNRGWKDYVSLAWKAPPEILILDGVEWMAFLFHERKMAHQLKALVVELNIPVLVQAIPHKRNGIDQPVPDKTIRKDFEEISDVVIAFHPKFVYDYKYGRTGMKRYHSLKTLLSSNWCPCKRCNAFIGPGQRFGGYSGGLTLQFVESHLQFC